MNEKARRDLSQLAMGTERLSNHFIERYYRGNQHRRNHHIGIMSIVCVMSILAQPCGEAPDVSAYIVKDQPMSHRVTVTAYTNIPACTDSTPNETASLLRIRPEHYGKVIALSSDLARKYKFGDKFYLMLNGEKHLVEFQDLMARRHKNRIDFLLASRKKCLNFGVTQGVLIPVDDKARPGAISRN